MSHFAFPSLSTLISVGLLSLASAELVAGTVSTVALDNGINGPRRFEVIVAAAGQTANAVVYPAPQVTPNFDLVTEFTPFVQAGPTGGARELISSSNNLVTFFAQTGIVRSSGTFTGPNGAINWVSEARLPAGSQRYENTISFNSTAPFGAVRFISYLNGSVVDRAAAIAPGTSDFNFLYLTADQNTSTTGLAHGIALNRLVNASYAGWVMREATTLFGNIVNPPREVFSLSGVIDPLVQTTTDPRLPGATVYRMFNSSNEPATAYAVDLAAGATSATVVTYLNAFPVVEPDGIFKNGFE